MKQEYEIVVVGAGPAGMAAACTAAERGHRVALIDDNQGPGGQIWRGGSRSKNGGKSRASSQWFRRLQNCSTVTRFFGCCVFDAPEAGVLHAEQNNVLVELGYEQLILTTGARERFLPFPGWTLPNVMGAGALQAMVKSGLPIEDKRVVIAGTGPLLLAVAAYLRDKGAKIVSICEQARWNDLACFSVGMLTSPPKLAEALHYGRKIFRVPFRADCWPVAAQGDCRLQSAVLSNGIKTWELPCDYLACGFHLVPNLELPILMGCRIEKGFVAVDMLQRTSINGIYCAGEPTGIGGLELALLQGEIAGMVSAGYTSGAHTLTRARKQMDRFVRRLSTAFALRPELKHLSQADTIVCRCEDVAYESISRHTSWRAAKLHTRCGMGPCQGRICGTALEFLMSWEINSVRPPIFPVQIANLSARQMINENSMQAQETK